MGTGIMSEYFVSMQSNAVTLRHRVYLGMLIAKWGCSIEPFTGLQLKKKSKHNKNSSSKRSCPDSNRGCRKDSVKDQNPE